MAVLERGTQLGKYRILDAIGRGGMGIVYLAEDTVLGRRVALKLLDRNLTDLKDFERRFREEARTLAALRHPNIVQIHNLERIGDQWVIDMDYLERGSLDDAQSGRPMKIGPVIGSVRQVLEALACCHHAGIVHRDVKPSNILFSLDGRALLTDFGLARLVSEHTRAAMRKTASSQIFMGTPRYAPPESWDGQEPTPAWDVYSVGVVLYEAVASKPPYEAETPFALVKQMAERRIPSLREIAPGVSVELSELVDSMLSRDVSVRPRDATEVRERLATTPESRDEATSAPATIVQALPRPRKPRRTFPGLRQRVIKVAAVTLLTAAVLAIGFATYHEYLSRRVTPGIPLNSGILFTTVDPSSQTTWEESWFMEPGTVPGTWTVLAIGPTHFWFMEARLGDNEEINLKGHWAEYTSKSALIFRQGTVEGNGRWNQNGQDMMVALRFRSAADGYVWRRPLLLEEAQHGASASEFARRFEDADDLQSLLYSELIPRRLPWAEEFEKTFLVPVASRTVLPMVSVDPDSITIDGHLTEPAWSSTIASDGSELGRLQGSPTSVAGRMLFRYGKDGVYVGISVKDPPANPRLTLTLLTSYDIPVANSTQWSIELVDGTTVRSARKVHGRESPWSCTWKTLATSTKNVYQAEVFIPFKSFGEGAAAPTPGVRWRVGCQLAQSDTSDQAASVYWQVGDTDETEHGAIIVFGTTS